MIIAVQKGLPEPNPDSILPNQFVKEFHRPTAGFTTLLLTPSTTCSGIAFPVELFTAMFAKK
jgi:hypothetical protein